LVGGNIIMLLLSNMQCVLVHMAYRGPD